MGLTLIKNNKNQIIGIFTDGDLRRFLSKKVNIETIKIKSLMTKSFKSINQNFQIKNAIDQMNKNKIYSLVVKNEKNQVVGLLRMHDILEAKII